MRYGEDLTTRARRRRPFARATPPSDPMRSSALRKCSASKTSDRVAHASELTVQTRPGLQAGVARELRRRVKDGFDRAGIRFGGAAEPVVTPPHGSAS